MIARSARRDATDQSNAPQLTDFESAVLAIVGSLGSGEIVTYGEVAAEVARPGAARAVGSVLRRHGSEVPWWRVVAANGRLVPGGEVRQAERLCREGVPVRDGRVVMGRATKSTANGTVAAS